MSDIAKFVEQTLNVELTDWHRQLLARWFGQRHTRRAWNHRQRRLERHRRRQWLIAKADTSTRMRDLHSSYRQRTRRRR